MQTWVIPPMVLPFFTGRRSENPAVSPVLAQASNFCATSISGAAPPAMRAWDRLLSFCWNCHVLRAKTSCLLFRKNMSIFDLYYQTNQRNSIVLFDVYYTILYCNLPVILREVVITYTYPEMLATICKLADDSNEQRFRTSKENSGWCLKSDYWTFCWPLNKNIQLPNIPKLQQKDEDYVKK